MPNKLTGISPEQILTPEEIELTESLYPGTKELIEDIQGCRWREEYLRILTLSYLYEDYDNIIEISKICSKFAVAFWHRYLYSIIVDDWENPSEDDLDLFHFTYAQTIKPLADWWKAFIKQFGEVEFEKRPLYSAAFALHFQGTEGIGLAGMFNWLTNKYVLLFPNLKESLKSPEIRQEIDLKDLEAIEFVITKEDWDNLRKSVDKETIGKVANLLVEKFGGFKEGILSGALSLKDLEKHELDLSTIDFILSKTRFGNTHIQMRTLLEEASSSAQIAEAIQRYVQNEISNPINLGLPPGLAKLRREYDLRKRFGFGERGIANVEEAIKTHQQLIKGYATFEATMSLSIEAAIMLFPIEAVIGGFIKLAKPVFTFTREAIFKKLNTAFLEAGIKSTRVAVSALRRTRLHPEAGRIMFPVIRAKREQLFKIAVKPKDFFAYFEMVLKSYHQTLFFIQKDARIGFAYLLRGIDTSEELLRQIQKGKIKVTPEQHELASYLFELSKSFKIEFERKLGWAKFDELFRAPIKPYSKYELEEIYSVTNSILGAQYIYLKEQFFSHLVSAFPKILESPIPINRFFQQFPHLYSLGSEYSYQFILNALGVRSRFAIARSVINNLYRKAPLLMLTAVQGVIFAAFIYEENIQAQSFITFYARTLGMYMTEDQINAAKKSVNNIAIKSERYKLAFIPFVGPIIALTDYFNAVRDNIPFLQDYIDRLAKEAQQRQSRENIANIFKNNFPALSGLNASQGRIIDPINPNITGNDLAEQLKASISKTGEIETSTLKMIHNALKYDLHNRIAILDAYLPEGKKFSLKAVLDNVELRYAKRNIIKNEKLYDPLRSLVKSAVNVPPDIIKYLEEKSAIEIAVENLIQTGVFER